MIKKILLVFVLVGAFSAVHAKGVKISVTYHESDIYMAEGDLLTGDYVEREVKLTLGLLFGEGEQSFTHSIPMERKPFAASMKIMGKNRLQYINPERSIDQVLPALIAKKETGEVTAITIMSKDYKRLVKNPIIRHVINILQEMNVEIAGINLSTNIDVSDYICQLNLVQDFNCKSTIKLALVGIYKGGKQELIDTFSETSVDYFEHVEF